PLRSQVAIDRLAVLTVAALMEFRKSGLPEQYERPDHRNVEQAHEYRRAANIFCALGQLMMLQRYAVYRRFQRRVHQLDDQNQQDARDHERLADPIGWHQQRGRQQDRRKQAFLAKGVFMAIRRLETGERVEQRVPDTPQTRFALVRTDFDLAQLFHVSRSSRAAFTSSRRLTGVVCGALLTRSGEASASWRTACIAVTNASSVSLDSVSVGSMSRHSGTSNGKYVVGAWKPLSSKRFAKSIAVTPVWSFRPFSVTMNS